MKRIESMLAGFLGVCAGLLPACSTPSINPIYSEEQTEVVKDDRIVGLWIPDDAKRDKNHYRVAAVENKGGGGLGGGSARSYTLTIEDEKGVKQNGGSELRLVRLGATDFIDVYPDNTETKAIGDRYGLAALPMHIIMPVQIKEGHVTAHPLNTEKVYKFLTEAPDTTPHAVRDNNFVILTGSTRQVQEFFRKIAGSVGDDQVFDEPLELSRAKADAGPAQAPAAEPAKPAPPGAEKRPRRAGKVR